MDKWQEDIDIEDLDEKSKELADLMGITMFLTFSKIYGGTRIYVNKHEEVIKGARNRMIKKEWSRYNTSYLAKKYNLTEERIKQIVKEENMRGTQTSIFDLPP